MLCVLCSSLCIFSEAEQAFHLLCHISVFCFLTVVSLVVSIRLTDCLEICLSETLNNAPESTN